MKKYFLSLLALVTSLSFADVTLNQSQSQYINQYPISSGGSGSGSVTSASVVSANGFAGSVATATSTPAITLTTSITGVLKGNGTAISAATVGTDYSTPGSTDTLTNKTFDTAGSGNVFKVNGVTISSNTGTGANVLATTPTLVTPVLGVATATSVNKMAITAPATSSTIAVADGKTLTSSNTLTLAGTDSTTITFQGSDTYVGRTTTDTLTNKTLTSPTMTTPSLGVATATSINFGGTALSNYTEGTFVPVAANLTVVGTPTYSGKYTRIGRVVFIEISITSTTSTASTNLSTTFTGLPYTQGSGISTSIATDPSATNLGLCVVSGSTIYPPTWSARASVFLAFSYSI